MPKNEIVLPLCKQPLKQLLHIIIIITDSQMHIITFSAKLTDCLHMVFYALVSSYFGINNIEDNTLKKYFRTIMQLLL